MILAHSSMRFLLDVSHYILQFLRRKWLGIIERLKGRHSTPVQVLLHVSSHGLHHRLAALQDAGDVGGGKNLIGIIHGRLSAHSSAASPTFRTDEASTPFPRTSS